MWARRSPTREGCCEMSLAAFRSASGTGALAQLDGEALFADAIGEGGAEADESRRDDRLAVRHGGAAHGHGVDGHAFPANGELDPQRCPRIQEPAVGEGTGHA